jgi:MFS family permease
MSRNLRVVLAGSFLSGLSSSMSKAIWQPFVLSLGAPMTIVGLLESIGGQQGIVTSMIQPVGGWLSDRLGRKRLLVAGFLVGVLGVALYVGAAITLEWRWLLAGVVLVGLGLIALPARDSLVAESVPVGRRASAFSGLMAALVAPGIFAPALGGYLADNWGFRPVLLTWLGLEALRLGLTSSLLQETVGPDSRSLQWRELGSVLARVFWPPKELRGLYWALSTDVFAWGLGWLLLFGMLSETKGFTPWQLGLMASAFSAAWVIAQLPLGRLMDRYGYKRFMVISECMGISLLVGWILADSFIVFVLLHAYFGVSAALWMPAQQALIATSVPANQRGEALGRLAAFRGLIGFPAPYIGGLLYDRFGMDAPLLANLLGAVIALIAIIKLVRDPESPQ